MKNATYTAKADKSGNFKVAIPLQKVGSKFTVTANDFANNTSPVTGVTVIDRIASVIQAVNPVFTISKSVSGKTEEGAMVIVTIATKTYTAKADTNGNYKVAIPLQKDGIKLTITAKDAAGNISSPKVVTVN